MGASWTWVLEDANGSPLAELATASGKQATFQRNTCIETACTLSHEEESARLLLTALYSSGVPRMTAYRDGVTRFRGYLAPFTEGADEACTLSLRFRSPFGRLLGDGGQAGRYTAPYLDYYATDAGAIAHALLTDTNVEGATGLVPGVLVASKLRDRSFDRANIGEQITNLTSVLDGFDFTERFIDGVGSDYAALDIAPSMGVVQPLARFEYGPDTLANLTSVERTTSPPINRATVVGANGLVGVKDNAQSIAQYGLWPVLVTQTEVTEQQTLDDKAQALLRPNPVATVNMTPDPVLAPKPFDDYNLGDTVALYARRGALLIDAPAIRVNGFTVVIDENGNEAASIPDPRTPEEQATIDSSLSVEVVSDGSV